MPNSVQSGQYHVEDVDLSNSQFRTTNLAKVTFDNVNLKAAVFGDVARTGGPAEECLA